MRAGRGAPLAALYAGLLLAQSALAQSGQVALTDQVSGTRALLQAVSVRARASLIDLLNETRRQLVVDFAIWAGGRPLFGAKPTASAVAPGLYHVVLTVGDKRFVQTLRVRADPLGSTRQ